MKNRDGKNGEKIKPMKMNGDDVVIVLIALLNPCIEIHESELCSTDAGA